MRLFTVKETREFTGLTGKQLYSYEKSIAPITRLDNDSSNGHKGYKLYDKDGLEKLSMAALFSELGAGPKKINEIFSQKNYDKMEVLGDLIAEAERKKQEFEDIIIVAETLKELDWSNMLFNPLSTKDIHSAAENIRRIKESDDYKSVVYMGEDNEKKLLQIFKGFRKVKPGKESSPKAESLVEELIAFIREELKVANWAMILTGMSETLIAGRNTKEIVDHELGIGIAETIGETIMTYQINHFLQELEYDYDDLNSIVGSPYENKRTKRIVDSYIKVINKWFGYDSYLEMTDFIRGIKRYIIHDKDDAESEKLLDYLYAAAEYYSQG